MCQLNTKLICTLQECYPAEVCNSHGSLFLKRVRNSTLRKQELQTVNGGGPTIKYSLNRLIIPTTFQLEGILQWALTIKHVCHKVIVSISDMEEILS